MTAAQWMAHLVGAPWTRTDNASRAPIRKLARILGHRRFVWEMLVKKNR